MSMPVLSTEQGSPSPNSARLPCAHHLVSTVVANTDPDELFANPRLVALYDILNGDREDLTVYADVVAEFGARSVIDLGCGTGTLACHLASEGLSVVGVDPAMASLDIARAKPAADRVQWIHGVAQTLPRLQADMALMTGNVAQVFTADDDWDALLRSVEAAIRPGGWFAFETRVPEARAWEQWVPATTQRVLDVPGEGRVETFVELGEVNLPFVSFRHVYRFLDAPSPIELDSRSTLRFRSRSEITESLINAGWAVHDVRDAPDRPGKEYVFIAQRGN